MVMLSSGPSPPTIRPARGRGPLHLAAEAGHIEICTLLVNLGGARLEQRSDEGLTPLMSACVTGNLEVLQTLVCLSADPQAGVDRSEPSRSVFHLLAGRDTKQHAACIKWLTSHLGALDPCQLLELLEKSDPTANLLSPVETARKQGWTHQALQRSLKQTSQRIEAQWSDRGVHLPRASSAQR